MCLLEKYIPLEITAHEKLLVEGCPYWRSVWACLRDIKSWRKRRRLDRAIVMLWNGSWDANDEVIQQLAHDLKEFSDDLWARAILRTYGHPGV